MSHPNRLLENYRPEQCQVAFCLGILASQIEIYFKYFKCGVQKNKH